MKTQGGTDQICTDGLLTQRLEVLVLSFTLSRNNRSVEGGKEYIYPVLG